VCRATYVFVCVCQTVSAVSSSIYTLNKYTWHELILFARSRALCSSRRLFRCCLTQLGIGNVQGGGGGARGGLGGGSGGGPGRGRLGVRRGGLLYGTSCDASSAAKSNSKRPCSAVKLQPCVQLKQLQLSNPMRARSVELKLASEVRVRSR
jgi:hypothetical protein